MGLRPKPVQYCLFVLLLLLAFAPLSAWDEAVPPAVHSPRLLLTPQRLKRLQRDRERQTVRWIDFENRVKSKPDSRQRGFELALYYAVTGDKQRGKEAVQWMSQHPCDYIRQNALIIDWVGAPEPPGLRNCPPDHDGGIQSLRDWLFVRIATGHERGVESPLPQTLVQKALATPEELYALCEFLDVVRSNQHADLREQQAEFFAKLPVRFLLSLRPDRLDHPWWEDHVSALGLVALDPNLESSQFLQGWAMEDRHMVRDGPGVGYEFLWANPYLPGVSYQNMETWLYEPNLVLARTDWSEQACWVGISATGVQQQNCPADWDSKPAPFGHLLLIPMTDRCVHPPVSTNTGAAILWKMKPHEKLTYTQNRERVAGTADAAGLWRVPANSQQRVCASR